MITAEQRKEINELKGLNEKIHLKKLQRIYNSTITTGEKDTSCMCTKSKRLIWRVGFDKWAKSNGFYD